MSVDTITIDGATHLVERFEVSINGIPTPCRTLAPGETVAYELQHLLPAMGDFTVTGDVTCYFENAALLEAFHDRNNELDTFLREVLYRPHKEAAWTTALPYLRRAAIVGVVIATSLFFATGAI